jgi:3-oxoacyl-[acyl-carrier protein] reductase
MGCEKEESIMNVITYPDLKGKVILVTGASKALGAETARQFAHSGAMVVVNGRDDQALKRVASSITSEGGECIDIAADVTSAAELNRLQASIQDRFGT